MDNDKYLAEYYAGRAFRSLMNFLDFGRLDVSLLKNAEKYIYKSIGIYENIEFRKHFEDGKDE